MICGTFFHHLMSLKAHLFARITVDGVASRFNTKLDVLPSIWDGKMGKATGRPSEASRINRMLDDINASLNTIYHEMQRRDKYNVSDISIKSTTVRDCRLYLYK